MDEMIQTMDEMIQTDDLLLKISNADVSKSLVAYYLRNKNLLQEVEPTHEQEFFTEEYQRSILRHEVEAAAQKEAFRWYISVKKEPDKIIGMIGLNNIVWGCFYSCFLGYKLDAQWLNQGYMTQAVQAAVTIAFEDLNLHRIEANVMPRNAASLRVLEKCGFEKEGFSRKYLKINGAWEGHIHMVKLNEVG